MEQNNPRTYQAGEFNKFMEQLGSSNDGIPQIKQSLQKAKQLQQQYQIKKNANPVFTKKKELQPQFNSGRLITNSLRRSASQVKMPEIERQKILAQNEPTHLSMSMMERNKHTTKESQKSMPAIDYQYSTHKQSINRNLEELGVRDHLSYKKQSFMTNQLSNSRREQQRDNQIRVNSNEKRAMKMHFQIRRSLVKAEKFDKFAQIKKTLTEVSSAQNFKPISNNISMTSLRHVNDSSQFKKRTPAVITSAKIRDDDHSVTQDSSHVVIKKSYSKAQLDRFDGEDSLFIQQRTSLNNSKETTPNSMINEQLRYKFQEKNYNLQKLQKQKDITKVRMVSAFGGASTLDSQMNSLQRIKHEVLKETSLDRRNHYEKTRKFSDFNNIVSNQISGRSRLDSVDSSIEYRPQADKSQLKEISHLYQDKYQVKPYEPKTVKHEKRRLVSGISPKKSQEQTSTSDYQEFPSLTMSNQKKEKKQDEIKIYQDNSSQLDVEKVKDLAGFDSNFREKIKLVEDATSKKRDDMLIQMLDQGGDVPPSVFDEITAPAHHDNIYNKYSKKKSTKDTNKISIEQRRKITQEKIQNEINQNIDVMKKLKEVVYNDFRDNYKEKFNALKTQGIVNEQTVKKLQIETLRHIQRKYTILSEYWVLKPDRIETSVCLTDEEGIRSWGGIDSATSHPHTLKSPTKILDQNVLRRGRVRREGTLNKFDAQNRAEYERSKAFKDRMRKKEERKRDNRYKRVMNIITKSSLTESSEEEEEWLPTTTNLTAQDEADESSDESVTCSPAEPSLKNSVHVSSQSSLKVGKTIMFDAQNDQGEALEFNGEELPEEFILAKLAFNEEPTAYWQNIRDNHQIKDDDRRNTGYHFYQADLYQVSGDSFNEQFKSEFPYQEINEGLTGIVNEFMKKTSYLKQIKFSEKNINQYQSDTKQIYQKFVTTSIKHQNVPIPALLKIKNGILYIPGNYTITQGVSHAFAEALGKDDEDLQIFKASFKDNNMSDKIHANMVKGLMQRKEFHSLKTWNNEVGKLFASAVAQMISQQIPEVNEDLEMILEEGALPEQIEVPQLNTDFASKINSVQQSPMNSARTVLTKQPKKKDKESATFIDELQLINCKCNPSAIDTILSALQNQSPQYLKKIAFQQIFMSDRQQKLLLNIIKESNFIEINLSWAKLQAKHLPLLFDAFAENKTVQKLDLSWNQFGGSPAHTVVMEKHFQKFCNFLKENTKLLHMNLTSINMDEKDMIELLCNIKRSRSLHCVHLCGNNLSEAELQMMSLKLKPTSIFGQVTNKTIKQKKKKLHQQVLAVVNEKYKERYEQIYDGKQLKEMQDEWQSVKTDYDKGLMGDKVFEPLILTKQLGHSEILNGKHWKIADECYQCDRWKYTVIFWDLKKRGKSFQIEDPLVESLIDDLIYESNDRLMELKNQDKLVTTARAFITGSFTDWQPRKMLMLDEFLAHIQKKDDVIKDADRRIVFADNVASNWRNMIKESVQYPFEDIQFIDYPELDEFGYKNQPKLDRNQLFVYVDFIKPGKHSYVVNYENTLIEPRPPTPQEIRDQRAKKSKRSSQRSSMTSSSVVDDFVPKHSTVKLTSYHQFVGNAYTGQYNINLKENKFDAVERTFDREKSVFKDWKLDRPAAISKEFLDEVQYWNVPNFVKDEAEQQEIVEYMQKQVMLLKTFYIIRSSQSGFPVVRWLNYSGAINELDFYDSNFDKGAVDRIFIAVTSKMDEKLKGILPEKDMSRFQFYESIVRVAMTKYKGAHTENVIDGLKKLFDEVLHPRVDLYSWMEWRKDRLWTLEVDDLYKTNMIAMQKLYKYYFITRKTNRLYLNDAIDMFTNQVDLELLPDQVAGCWGMSKMTVNNDIKNRNNYFQANIAEFLEMFARLANLKFSQGVHKNDSLEEKIAALMDVVFPIVGCQRKEVNIEDEYVSVSEDPLDEDKYFM